MNPLIVEGQVHGGITQGIAAALYEEAIYDEDGNLANGTLASYLVPSAAELPSFELGRTESKAPGPPVRREGRGGDRHDRGHSGRDQRRARRPLAPRRHRHPDTSHARAGLARDRGGEAVIPAAFDYEVAESVEHAISLLGGDPDAKVLAGGHSLVPALKLRISRPSKLVDIGRLSDLAYVRDDGTHVAIGALTRHAAVHADPLLREHCPIVSTTAGMIGDPQVRHRGTIGGSLAHGDPASDLPAVVLALGARSRHRRRRRRADGVGGRRSSPASSRCAVGPGEVLTEIRVPKLGGSTGWSYRKYHRRAQDWATVGVAALVHRDNGSAVGASVALVEHGRHAAAGEGGRGCDCGGSDAGGRRRACSRGHGAAERHRGLGGVPRAPRARAHAAGTRGGDGLSGWCQATALQPGTDSCSGVQRLLDRFFRRRAVAPGDEPVGEHIAAQPLARRRA